MPKRNKTSNNPYRAKRKIKRLTRFRINKTENNLPNQQYPNEKENAKKKSFIEKYGTWSDIIGVAISLAVAICTLLLFNIARIDSNTAKEGVRTAQQAIADQRRADSFNRE